MVKKIERYLLVGALLSAIGLCTPALALPMCSGLLTVAALTSSGGCTLGSDTFSNFSVTGANLIGGASANAVDPNFVVVQFSTDGVRDELAITNSNAASWSLTGAQLFSFQLNYRVTGTAAYFSTFNDGISASTTNSAAGASVTESVTSASGTAFLNANDQNPTAPLTSIPGSPVTTFTVADNADVHASNFNAILTNVTNTFVTTRVATVPEPATLALLGLGLSGLALTRRRKPH